MAKKTKGMFDAVQKEALKAVAEATTTEPTNVLRGVYTKNDIASIKLEKPRKEVERRFNEYVLVAQEFNEARIAMTVAKLNLMNVLDKPFFKEGRITRNEHWNILGVDGAGNIVYREDGRSYKTRLHRSNIKQGKVHTVDRTDTEKQTAWDWADEDTPELVTVEDYTSTKSEDTLQDTPQGTSKRTFKYDDDGSPDYSFDDEFQDYVAAFKAIKDINRTIQVFKDDLSPEERGRLLNQLGHILKAKLLASLSEDERKSVEGFAAVTTRKFGIR